MLLWDIIRDWFVQYIFGGMDSAGVLYNSNTIGYVDVYIEGIIDDSYRATVSHFPALSWTTPDGWVSTLSLGDWLSTTATLIVLISICFGLFFLVRYFFRMFAGLLSVR